MSNEYKNLSFLFSRMTWPSLMVRERACASIAELLLDQECKPIVEECLKDWMKSQQLESLALFPLFVLLRARIIDEDFEIPSQEEWFENLGKPSVLSFMLFKELDRDNLPEPNWANLCLCWFSGNWTTTVVGQANTSLP